MEILYVIISPLEETSLELWSEKHEWFIVASVHTLDLTWKIIIIFVYWIKPDVRPHQDTCT